MIDAQLLQRIEDLITSGGNGTTAQDVRDVLTDIVNNKWSKDSNQLSMASGGVIKINSVQVIKGQESAITDAVVAHNMPPTYDDTSIEGALNALGGKINSILGAMRNHGLIASEGEE